MNRYKEEPVTGTHDTSNITTMQHVESLAEVSAALKNSVTFQGNRT